jgi:hypothetical protein
MNTYTKQIASLLKIDLEIAKMVQEHINNKALLDWSECSERKFRQVVREAYAFLNA